MSNGSGHLLHVTEPFILGGHLYEMLKSLLIPLRAVTFAALNIGYANSLVRTGEFLEITPCPVICLQSGKDLMRNCKLLRFICNRIKDVRHGIQSRLGHLLPGNEAAYALLVHLRECALLSS